MRCACIDVGSNTTRLLVAEPDGTGLREVASRRVFTRLHCDEQAIPAATATAIAAEVAAQTVLAADAGAERITIVATSAIRQAANGDELCAAIERASGIAVVVLSAEQEARLAFDGALGMLERAPTGTVAVVDVGGGSTEIACGTVAGVSWSASVCVGSGSLADRFLRGDPPSPDQLERIRAHVAEAFEEVEAPPVEAAFAVGGSASSLRRLVGAELGTDALRDGLRALLAGCAEELAARFDLHLERVRVLPAGLLLLDRASRLLGVPLTIARGGLREGIILGDQRGAAA